MHRSLERLTNWRKYHDSGNGRPPFPFFEHLLKTRPATLSASIAILVGLLALGIFAHQDSYRGYFEDDDLDTLTWARLLPIKDLVWNIPTLKYPPEHSRPVGYLYYDILVRRVGLRFPPYVIALQIIHIANIWLAWLLLRKLGLDGRASAVGCVFFVLHRALFDAWWKPMFIYDVACTTFSLLAILAYASRRWIASLLCFWLAVRTKEVAIVLPAVFLCYELMLGDRKWKRALPFFVPAVIYGVNGFLYNLHQTSNYSIRIGPADIWKSVAFYSSKVFQFRYAGFLLLVTPFVARDRRLYFGLGAALLSMSIYLTLPGRLNDVYLYLPMVGVVIVMAVLASRYPALMTVLALAWLAWNFGRVRRQARVTLAEAVERRTFVMALRHVAGAPVYLYDKIPASMHSWGVEGALRLFHPDIEAVRRLDDLNPPARDPMQLLTWDAGDRQLTATPISLAEASMLHMDREIPRWQLGPGWLAAEGGRRAIEGRASTRLYRPPGTVEFDWRACLDSDSRHGAARGELRAIVDGEKLPAILFQQPGCLQQRVPVKSRPAGIVGVDFLPSSENGQLALESFGFTYGPKTIRNPSERPPP